MNVTFAPRGILQIDDARIVFRNFSGAPGPYNRAGVRSFSLVIPTEEIADALLKEGWNVRIKPPREEGDTPFMHLPVKIRFNDRGPRVYLQSGTNLRTLTEETIGCLDHIDISNVCMDIRPFDWDVNGSQGRSAYLQSIKVVQEVDRFMNDMAANEYPEDDMPF